MGCPLLTKSVTLGLHDLRDLKRDVLEAVMCSIKELEESAPGEVTLPGLKKAASLLGTHMAFLGSFILEGEHRSFLQHLGAKQVDFL